MLAGNDLALAVDLASWKEKMHRLWHQVHIDDVEAEGTRDVSVGTRIPITATISCGDIPSKRFPSKPISESSIPGAIVGGN